MPRNESPIRWRAVRRLGLAAGVAACLLSTATPARSQYGKGGYGFNPGYDQFGLYAFGFGNSEGWAYGPGPGMERDGRDHRIRSRTLLSPASHANHAGRSRLAALLDDQGRVRWPIAIPASVDRPLDREGVDRRMRAALAELESRGRIEAELADSTREAIETYGRGVAIRLRAAGRRAEAAQILDHAERCAAAVEAEAPIRRTRQAPPARSR